MDAFFSFLQMFFSICTFLFLFFYVNISEEHTAELLSLKYCEAVVIFFYSFLNFWNRITSLKIIIRGPHIIYQLKELLFIDKLIIYKVDVQNFLNEMKIH